jgi:hypothetical protein
MTGLSPADIEALENRRWSNTFLKVDLIEDPRMKLRSLRTFIAGEIVQHRGARQAFRVRANEEIDAGAHRAMIGAFSEAIKRENAVLTELRRIGKELGR